MLQRTSFLVLMVKKPDRPMGSMVPGKADFWIYAVWRLYRTENGRIVGNKPSLRLIGASGCLISSWGLVTSSLKLRTSGVPDMDHFLAGSWNTMGKYNGFGFTTLSMNAEQFISKIVSRNCIECLENPPGAIWNGLRKNAVNTRAWNTIIQDTYFRGLLTRWDRGVINS